MVALLSKGALALFALTAFAFAPSATATGPVAVSAYSDIEDENERKLGLRGQQQNVTSPSLTALNPYLSINCLGYPNLKPLKFSVFQRSPNPDVYIYDGCKDGRGENLLFSAHLVTLNCQLCVPEEGYYVIGAYHRNIDSSGVFNYLMGRDSVMTSVAFGEQRRGGVGVGLLLGIEGEYSSIYYEAGSKSSCPIVARYYCAEKGVDPGDDKICMFGIEDKDLVCGGCSPNEECRLSECQGRGPLPAKE